MIMTSRLLYLVRLASRQLLFRKRQAWLIISGIGVGVMVLITALSLMDGILGSVKQKIVDNSPHIAVTGERLRPPVPDTLYAAVGAREYLEFVKNTERQEIEVIKNYPMVQEVLRREPLVTTIAPVVFTSTIGLFGTLSLPVPLLGIIPSESDRIQHFRENTTAGNFDELTRTPEGVVLGTSLAHDMTARVGDRFQVVGTSGDRWTVRVVGIFSTGINDVDNSAYGNLPLVQAVAGLAPDEVTQFSLRVGDLGQDRAVAGRIGAMINYKATTWEENAAGVIALFTMMSAIVYCLVFFVIVVAGFGVANILITNVLERYRDIAIMKSIGFRRGEISAMYMLQGIMVACIGAGIGCLLGMVMIQVLGAIPITPSQTGTIRSDRLSMGFSGMYFLTASALALIVCIAASVGPSRRAARVLPVEILRGER
jgi:lipoprotein-releasing system permease protein